MAEKRKTALAKLPTPLPLVLLFFLAVLLPSVALSMLALRAADREALHVERGLEGALLSEINFAANRVSDLLKTIEYELEGEASEIPSALSGLRRWRGRNPLAALPFLLVNGRVFLPEAASPAKETFRAAFSSFLEGRSELPVFDHIAGVYRRELNELHYESPTTLPPAPERDERAGVSGAGKRRISLEDESEEAFSVAEAPPEISAPAAPLPAPSLGTVAPKMSAPGGMERQMAESRIAADSALREQVFRKAEEEGFELLQRNVAPLARAPSVPEAEEPSKTVARGKRFDEVYAGSLGGLLPRLSDGGLDLLFWSSRSDGTVAGFLLDRSVLRDRIAGVLPELLNDARILTVLDDRGEPLLVPAVPSPPDWRRPFVAREITPLLPRWEIGAWLSDPSSAASRARSATRAVWILVALLFFVIVLGGAAILRMLSSEMRLARQKTTYVANVSHELKTPLTSIRLFAEMLLSGRQQNEERRREYLRTMVSEAERLSRLVDNVLTFSRRGSGREAIVLEALDLATLAKETLSQLEPHLSRNGFRSGFAADGPLPVRGNCEALRQVLMNLLSNAEKYSEAVREIEVRCRRRKNSAIVEIADRGPGIPSFQAEKIFQEFFRGDDSLTASRSGAGLGLSIARDLARRHGGDVTYAPREGGGSVFSLTLPLSGSSQPIRGGEE
jgi:signal transduction histidine kinase